MYIYTFESFRTHLLRTHLRFPENPYEPSWALMDRYSPLWPLMDPYGRFWALVALMDLMSS